MNKRGRPRNIGKGHSSNRRHTIVLSEYAEHVFRQVSKQRLAYGMKKRGWFDEWVSNMFVKEFGKDSAVARAVMKELLVEAQRNKMDAIEHYEEVANKYAILKEQIEVLPEIHIKK